LDLAFTASILEDILPMTRRSLVAMFALVLVVSANAFAADSWPVFHGPDGTNKSPDTGLLQEWPEGGPELIWKTDGLGTGYSTVSVANRMIYTAGNLDEKTIVIALDMDGNVVWTAQNGDGWTGSFPGTRATPTVDGARVYHESPLGNVICLNAKSGEKIWELNILEEFEGENIIWALSESLIVDGNHLICCPFGKKASVVALDKMTGKVVWAAESTGDKAGDEEGEATTDKAGYGTPALVEYEGIRMVLTMNQKAVVGVDADSGKLLFRHPHETKYDVNVLIPVFHDGQVFVSSGYGAGSQMLKLTVDGKTVSAEQLWESKELDNHHGGVILLDGHIYGTNSKGKWICLDWKTGESKWNEKGMGKGAVTFADGLLYGMNESEKKRTVGLINPTPDAYEQISEFQLPEGGEGKCWAHPVIIGGRLYLRHGDLLFAYNVKAD
jgi:outer membrane protein assembly factor BamB